MYSFSERVINCNPELVPKKVDTYKTKIFVTYKMSIKVVSVLSFREPDTPKMPKMSNFGFTKMGLQVPETKDGNHFFTPTSPENGGKDICVVRLPLLGGVLSCFWVRFSLSKDKKTKGDVLQLKMRPNQKVKEN